MRTTAKCLTLALALAAALNTTGAHADHGADASGWLEQAGNGSGGNAPAIANFDLGTALFDANRFPIGSVKRPDWPKWLAFGTVPAVDLDGNPASQLAMTRGGDDALNWGAPSPAFIRDQNGNDIPFVLSRHATFDVVNQTFINYPFVIVYRVPSGDPYSRGSSPLSGTLNTVNAIHAAVSEDGVHWFADRAIEEDLASPVIQGSAATSFKRGIEGPSDLIVNPTGATNCTTAVTAAFPWNCRFVLVYTALGIGGVRSIAVAGAGSVGTDGLMTFRGIGSPLLTTGGSWDSAAVAYAHVRSMPNGTYEMTYSGAQGAPTCAGGTLHCYSLGQATSANGLTFSRSNPSRPMTPRTLLDQFGADQPSSLVSGQIVGPPAAGHIRGFYVRKTSVADTFQGFTSPAIGTAPRLRIGMPDNGVRTTALTPIELYLGDDLGTNVGIDATTIDLRIDGIPVADLGASVAYKPTLVGTYFVPGIRVSSTGVPISLPDGPHSFTATLRDLDGEPGQISTNFIVDTTPPKTSIDTLPAGPILSPVQTIGKFTATTKDVGSAIQRVRALVVNPLGQYKVYDSLADGGFTVTQVSAQEWEWSWFGPALDPHLLIPGEYTIALHGVDAGGATERPSASNTTKIIVL